MRTAPAARQTQRPGTGRTASRPRTMSGSARPRACPVAAAASAFATLCDPARARRTGCSRPAMASVNSTPPVDSLTGPTARTSADGRRPKARTGAAADRDVEPAPVRRRQPPEGGRRVVDEHDRHVAGQVVGQRVDDEAGGAATDRLSRERVTVEAVPADREERLADGERARVDGDALPGHAQVAADPRAGGRPAYV